MRFVCKRCGAESPAGIGYAAEGQTSFPAPDPACPNYHARIDSDALNVAARFLPMDLDDEDTLPCVEIAGVQVYVYFNAAGTLFISPIFDTADPSLFNADGRVEVCIVGGQRDAVYR